MSLDVYLIAAQTKCHHCGGTGLLDDDAYSANITHNLGRMAEAAGIYEYLWRPEDVGATTAKDLIEPLRKGLRRLKAAPEKYKQFNAENGWGLYEHFVPFVERYLDACLTYPDAKVRVSR
jgi:hypothetical protein